MIVPYQFAAPAQENEPAHLYILGDIVEGAWTWPGEGSPVTLLDKLGECGAKELICHIDSYGGSTSAGIAMYNMLKNCGASVTTIAEGFCCSAASLVFMAGDKRLMRGASLLMIHNAWANAAGNAAELRKTADDLDKISKTAANIYREHTSLEDGKLEELLDAESWIDPEEAVQWGFATAVEQENPQEDAAYSSAFQCIRDALRKEPEPPKTAFQKMFQNFM